MADNTKQWDYIALIKSGFEVLFQERPDEILSPGSARPLRARQE